MSEADVIEAWEGERARLHGLAYRLTGEWATAEDLVQEAFARLADSEHVDSPAAWLTTVTTRLAIDHLRSARRQRETYVGPWVPEPVAEEPTDPAEDVTLAESVSLALLVVLESMSPLERAAFVLHDVFGYAHPDVAAMLDRSPAAVRQAAARGRRHVEARRPRFEPDPAVRREVGERFLAAARGRDLDELMQLLSPDVVFRSDGGGVVTAARKVLQGRQRVTKFLLALADTNPNASLELEWRNAGPAVRITDGDTLVAVMALHVADGQVVEFNTVLNPAKLRGVR